MKRVVYRITGRGLTLLKDEPSEVRVKALRQFPEFEEFEGKGARSVAADGECSNFSLERRQNHAGRISTVPRRRRFES